MAAIIQNPILNSPFLEPAKHWKFGEDGITDEVVFARRISSYFVPIPPPKKKVAQLALQTGWTSEREKPNELINQIRQRVNEWRLGHYQGVTPVTRGLLDYWTNVDRERPLFFCQVEALETAIYLSEVADRFGQAWINKELRRLNELANPSLFRVATKMATGSGKTVVMAMLIAWQALNKLAEPQDKRFSDAFLIVTPGITIRDRLRVLLPNDPGNYFVERDIVPPDQLELLQRARIVITNYHSFALRDRSDVAASSQTKKILAGPAGDIRAFRETPRQMIRRVSGELCDKKSIVILNDEAHHCYRENPRSEEEHLGVDEKTEAEHNREAARVWYSGLEAFASAFDVRSCYDLSATPFFLRGSGYKEGTLFPWVVSDFSLIDAIECGIVKIPRVPVSDNQVSGEMPTYRDLWLRIRDELPRKGARRLKEGTEPHLPAELQGALISLYQHYEKAYHKWIKNGEGTPPVFIVVCSNTAVSKLVYDYIAGWEKVLPDERVVVVPGQLAVFNNEEDGAWRSKPNTFLIDSTQIDSGAGMDDTFKRAARAEIAEFKADLERRFPGRSVEITDEALLREVLNTVGRRGRLGESVKCVVSVSMLTEGWDANTVTHILGVRAFGTQLLCEQVVGRGLRRISYEPGADGLLPAEYAEVYGVPFSFIPTAGTKEDTKPPKAIHHVRALPDRAALNIQFPHVVGYRYELPADHLRAKFDEGSRFVLSTDILPTRTTLEAVVGEATETNLDVYRGRREQEVAFRVAETVLKTRFDDAVLPGRPWLFPQLLSITKQWLRECLTCKDDTFPQLLLAITSWRLAAAEKIYRSIVSGTSGEKRLLPVLRSYQPIGSTADVAFDTTKGVYATINSPLNYVVLDSADWEAKVAEALEDMNEVTSYCKNDDRVGFRIPYVDEGTPRNYVPDFLIRWRVDDREVMIIAEVTGEKRRQKAEKASTAKDLWVPAVNNLCEFGQWTFVEITAPDEAKQLLRAHMQEIIRLVNR